MSTKTQCYHCGRIARGCRQILRFEPGDGWHIVKLMSGDVVQAVKRELKGKYICPECYDFEVTVMHSKVTFQPWPLTQIKRAG
jgi:hypothetical protein